MSKEIYLNGLTTDQLSEMIRESVRDEMQNIKSPKPKSEVKYLTRKETARRLKVSLVTLTDWVNRGKIKAHKIGGRVLFRECDVEEAVAIRVRIKDSPTIRRKRKSNSIRYRY